MKTPIFQSVQMNDTKSNVFDLSNDRKLSTVMGRLTPIFLMDCVPGDKVSVKPNVFIRFAPLLAPIMHRVNVYCHFWFVPNRILWAGWENFITGGEDGEDATVWPFIDYNPGSEVNGSLFDHMGLPTSADGFPDDVSVSAIPFAAYQRIYNEYYRDQNLIAEIENTDLLDGDNTANIADLTTFRYRSWQHDYFTSALPWTQKGPEALLPVTGEAPVYAYDATLSQPPQYFREFQGMTPVPPGNIQADSNGNPEWDDSVNPPGQTWLDLNGTHYADLASSVQTTINDLRQAIKLQQWLERNARGGSRYSESMRVHFDVISDDARLQRPEYIGGFSSPVSISEVLQTGMPQVDPATGEPYAVSTPTATMAGHGVSVGSGGYSSYYAKEHGYIMGIMSVMPMSQYQQGIPKHFLRSDKFDYYWPSFANLGEQPILKKEIMCSSSTTNEEVFGYTPRYAEYRFINNTVHGDMRGTLDFWHLGRKFNTVPGLNQDFITLDPEEVVRIFAVEDGGDNLWCHVLNEVKASRKMPVYATPGF